MFELEDGSSILEAVEPKGQIGFSRAERSNINAITKQHLKTKKQGYEFKNQTVLYVGNTN